MRELTNVILIQPVIKFFPENNLKRLVTPQLGQPDNYYNNY